MVSIIPLSQFRYAHCQLPLGRGAFRPCVKLSDKFQFVDYLKISDCRAGACSCRQNKTERASPFPTNPTLKQLNKFQFKSTCYTPHIHQVLLQFSKVCYILHSGRSVKVHRSLFVRNQRLRQGRQWWYLRFHLSDGS